MMNSGMTGNMMDGASPAVIFFFARMWVGIFADLKEPK
jgi:hypothetical protein